MNAQMVSGRATFVSFTPPFTPGSRAIGRVAAIGPDTTRLKQDQLVLLEPQLRARDDSDIQIFLGASDGASAPGKQLFQYWRQGLWAEYSKVPLENCHMLNESLLEKYKISELLAATMQMVPYGGFRDIDLKAGETIIVGPATGLTSGAAVEVASAMGARVIAASRNITKLQKLADHNANVHPVQITGNEADDLAALQKFGKVDAFLDLSPFVEAAHIKPSLMSLKKGGRASLMGGPPTDFSFPNMLIIINNLTIKGRMMYDAEQAKDFVRLVNAGILKFGKEAGHEVVGQFGLGDWQEAFEAVGKVRDAGRMTMLVPFGHV